MLRCITLLAVIAAGTVLSGPAQEDKQEFITEYTGDIYCTGCSRAESFSGTGDDCDDARALCGATAFVQACQNDGCTVLEQGGCTEKPLQKKKRTPEAPDSAAVVSVFAHAKTVVGDHEVTAAVHGQNQADGQNHARKLLKHLANHRGGVLPGSIRFDTVDPGKILRGTKAVTIRTRILLKDDNSNTWREVFGQGRTKSRADADAKRKARALGAGWSEKSRTRQNSLYMWRELVEVGQEISTQNNGEVTFFARAADRNVAKRRALAGMYKVIADLGYEATGEPRDPSAP